jgi:hypothetical protein
MQSTAKSTFPATRALAICSTHTRIRLLELTGVEGVQVKKRAVVVSAFTLEARLKRRIREHLRKLGFERGPGGALVAPSSSKESIRALHFEQRRDGLRDHRAFVRAALPKLETYFANGSEVDPKKVQPRLELVEAALGGNAIETDTDPWPERPHMPLQPKNKPATKGPRS